MRGGNNHAIIVEILTFEEEEPDDKEIIDHVNWEYNHDYLVKVDIPLF